MWDAYNMIPISVTVGAMATNELHLPREFKFEAMQIFKYRANLWITSSARQNDNKKYDASLIAGKEEGVIYFLEKS